MLGKITEIHQGGVPPRKKRHTNREIACSGEKEKFLQREARRTTGQTLFIPRLEKPRLIAIKNKGNMENPAEIATQIRTGGKNKHFIPKKILRET